jgi:hypothetical protein
VRRGEARLCGSLANVGGGVVECEYVSSDASVRGAKGRWYRVAGVPTNGQKTNPGGKAANRRRRIYMSRHIGGKYGEANGRLERKA